MEFQDINRQIELCPQLKKTLLKYQFYHHYLRGWGATKKLGCYKYLISDSSRWKEGVADEYIGYYWHVFDEGCCLDNSIDYNLRPSLKKDRFIMNKIDDGTWNFNNTMIDNLKKYIVECSKLRKSDEDFVVYLPQSRKMNKDAFDKYILLFKPFFKKNNIRFAFSSHKTFLPNTKTIVFILDFVTSPQRQKNVVEGLKKASSNGFSLLYFSMMKIFSYEDAVQLAKIEESKPEITIRFRNDNRDDEDYIMKSLSGRGVDPESLGF